MDTTHHNTAETWVAGYADYLRDAVGAADATRARHHSPNAKGNFCFDRVIALDRSRCVLDFRLKR
jgi:hypothetical protein